MSDPSDRIRGTTASIDNAAKQLRKTLTPAEQHGIGGNSPGGRTPFSSRY